MSARGEWKSEAIVVLITASALVRLAAPLEWQDASGRLHTVPVGFISDGATIPRWAWWFVGGPLEGPFRRAALLHDWQCVQQTESSAAVHRRFYQAMRADQVPAWIAGLFYGLVQAFGPRWAAVQAVTQ